MPNNTPAPADLVEAVEQAWWDNVRDKMGQPRQAFPKSRTDITGLIAFTIAEINRSSEPSDDAQITAARAGEAWSACTGSENDGSFAAARIIEAYGDRRATAWKGYGHAHDEEGNILICTGCGSSHDLELLRVNRPGTISCCPERKMVRATPATPQPDPRDAVVAELADAAAQFDGWEGNSEEDEVAIARLNKAVTAYEALSNSEGNA